MKRKVGEKRALGVFQWLLMAILFLVTLTMLLPLLHILARSLSDPTRSASMAGLDILPKGFSLINYQVIFSNKNVVPSLLNSLFITLVGTTLNILLTIMAAYVLTRPNLVGKRVLMVGDRNDDMRGAADCGLDAAGVLYGYGSREELEPFHPVLLAESCADLADRLLAARV